MRLWTEVTLRIVPGNYAAGTGKSVPCEIRLRKTGNGDADDLCCEAYPDRGGLNHEQVMLDLSGWG